MKTIFTLKYLKPFLFCSLVICSISCTLFLNAVTDSKSDASATTMTTQDEEFSMPDVFAVKNLIEKIIKYLPAS